MLSAAWIMKDYYFSSHILILDQTFGLSVTVHSLTEEEEDPGHERTNMNELEFHCADANDTHTLTPGT